jgi:hypothetical protein
MKLIWRRDKSEARLGDSVFTIRSEVRNELNGRRRLHDPDEVVNIVRENGTWGHAYMPRPFPLGVWKITGVEKTGVPVFAPVKIKTDAHQKVELWNLDGRGGYDRPSGVFAEDYGYHLHWSAASRTTLGCGRVGMDSAKEALALAALIEAARKNGEEVLLEVI